jgi:hypothetical protein
MKRKFAVKTVIAFSILTAVLILIIVRRFDAGRPETAVARRLPPDRELTTDELAKLQFHSQFVDSAMSDNDVQIFNGTDLTITHIQLCYVVDAGFTTVPQQIDEFMISPQSVGRSHLRMHNAPNRTQGTQLVHAWGHANG